MNMQAVYGLFEDAATAARERGASSDLALFIC